MVRVPASIKGHFRDPFLQARLGNDFTHFLCHFLVSIMLQAWASFKAAIYDRHIYIRSELVKFLGKLTTVGPEL